MSQSVELTVDTSHVQAGVANINAKRDKSKPDSVQLDVADWKFSLACKQQRVLVGAIWLAALVPVIGSLVLGVQVRNLLHKQMPAAMEASFDFVALGLSRAQQIGVAFTTIFQPALLSDLSARYGFDAFAEASTVVEGERFWAELRAVTEDYATRLVRNDLAPKTASEFANTYIPFMQRQMPWESQGMEKARTATNETELLQAQEFMSFRMPEKNNETYFNIPVLTSSLVKVQVANAADLADLKQDGRHTREKAVRWAIAGVSVLCLALVMAALTTAKVHSAEEKLKQAIRASRRRLRRRMDLDEIRLVVTSPSAESNVIFGNDDDNEDEGRLESESPRSDAGSSDAGDDRRSYMGESVLSGSTRLSHHTGGTGTSGSRATSTSPSSTDWRRRAQRTLKQKDRIVSLSFLLCWTLLMLSTVLFWVQAEQAEDDVKDIADVQVPLATKSYKVVSDFESAWSAVMLAVTAESDSIRELYSNMTFVTLGQFQTSWQQIEALSQPPPEAVASAETYMQTLGLIAQKTFRGGNNATVAEARVLFNSTLQESMQQLLEYAVPLRDTIVRDVDEVTDSVQRRINTALGIAVAALIIGVLVAVFLVSAENKRADALQLHWNARTWSLERVIDHAELCPMLLKQAQELYCGENVDFLSAYRMAARNGLTSQHLAELYHRFLHSKAPDMLNISHELRSKVADLFEQTSQDEVLSGVDAEERAARERQAMILAEKDPVLRTRRLRALATVHEEVSRLVSTNLLQTLLQSTEFVNWQREHRAHAELELKLLQKRAGLRV
ncbi:MAG: hypothetical protein MHM6MM_003490 [Cercozoa sp. M6MM]